MPSLPAAVAAHSGPSACRMGGGAAVVPQAGGIYLPSRKQRSRRGLLCRAAGGGGPQWRFDDLTAASSSGLTSFDDLWGDQMRAMQRAQDRMELQRREMEQRFEAVQREAQAASGSGRQAVQEHSGPCGYHWQRSYSHNGPGYQEFRSESFSVVGVPPPGHCGMMQAPPPSALHMDPLSSLGLLLAAALAGFWAAATAAFNRRFGLTTYREESRWRLLLLWPLLLLTSPEFREQFWAAVRGRRGGGGTTLAAGGKQA